MNISTAGLDLIKDFEGYHRKLPNGDCVAYRCPANVLTIGWGCTEGVREGMVWTVAQAEEALRREVAKFEAAVTRLVTVEINQNQFDALVSFAYNCGEGALASSTLLRRLNAGNFDGAADAFAMWTKGGGRVLPGLVTRRAREAALFRTPAETSIEPLMAQAVEPNEPTRAEVHEEAHQFLIKDSWFYWANRLNIKSITAGGVAAMAYAQEHALEIGGLVLLAVIAFEGIQYLQRNQRIATQ